MAAAASLVIDVGKKLSESAKNCEKGEARSELSSSLYSSLARADRGELRRCSALLSTGTAFADRGRVKRDGARERVERGHIRRQPAGYSQRRQQMEHASFVTCAPGVSLNYGATAQIVAFFVGLDSALSLPVIGI